MKNVKEGATLQCTFGTMESKLQIPNKNDALLQEENEAIITDCISGIHIMPFGTCNCPATGQAPCTPLTISPWLNGKHDFVFGVIPVLLENSMLPCAKGGIITIKHVGQK